MATFRIHLSTEPNVSPVTNLITGIGELRDETDNATAESLLCKLESEIAFVRRFILDSGHTAYAQGMTRLDSNRNQALTYAPGYIPCQNTLPTDIRKPATGKAIHP